MKPALCFVPIALALASCVHAEDLPVGPADAAPETSTAQCSTEGGAEVVAAVPTEVLGMAAGAGYTYWSIRQPTQPKPGLLSRVKVEGGPVEAFATGDYAAREIHVDGKLSSVFWLEGSTTDDTASLKRKSTEGGPIREVIPTAKGPKTFAIFASFIYAIGNEGVLRADFDGTDLAFRTITVGTPPGVTLSSPRVIGASKDSLAIYSDDQGVVLVPREGAQPYRGKVVDADTASSFGDAIAFDADSAYWVSDKKLKRVKVDSTTTGSASSLDSHVLTAFSFGNRIYYSVYDPSADGVGGVIRRAEGDANPTLILRRKLKIERFAITPSALFWAEASGGDGFCIMKKAMTFDAGTGP